jgi:hypothetical protein
MGEATIIPRSLKTKWNKIIFQNRPYLLIIDFPKFDPLTAVGMAYVSILGQNVKIYSPYIYSLSLRLSGIEFSLV